MRTLIALLAGAMLGAVAPASPAVAQGDPAVPPAPRPGWLPRYSRLDPHLTAAERATILTRLNAIERLVLQVPELARPEGFEVWPTVGAGVMEIWPFIQGHHKGNYVVQSYQLQAFQPSQAINGEGMTCLEIIVNPLPPQVSLSFAGNDLDDGKGDRLYVEHPFGAKVPGALLAYGQKTLDADEPGPSPGTIGLSPTSRSWYAVFFTADGVSPWVEVTRQEYLEAQIRWETRELEETQRNQQVRPKTPYQRWLEEAPQRKRERDEALAAVEKADPSLAAAMRKEAEAAEREIGEQLKAAEAEDRVLASMAGDRWRAQLAGMSPEERAMPAWTDGGGGLEFFQPHAPGAVRIVRANPTFYGPRSPRTLPRGVIVRFTASLTCHARNVQRAFHAVYEKLDYAALRRLLEAEPR